MESSNGSGGVGMRNCDKQLFQHVIICHAFSSRGAEGKFDYRKSLLLSCTGIFVSSLLNLLMRERYSWFCARANSSFTFSSILYIQYTTYSAVSLRNFFDDRWFEHLKSTLLTLDEFLNMWD